MDDKYDVLKGIVDDYIMHMENVNEQRLECATKELAHIRQEMKLFSFLQRTTQILFTQQQAIIDAISENQQLV